MFQALLRVPCRRLHVVRSIQEMRALRASLVAAGKTVGFVPTMGALHEGHLQLVKHAKQGNHVAIASIFVNPTQFGPNEDFDRYPRMVDSDVQKLQTVHTDYVFVPSTQDMYPGDPPQAVFVTVDGVEKVAEGGSRPGFFRGVATVVSKLFNIVQPTKAYFGQKDGMQCIVLRRMVRELNFPVELVICPTVRESDGLAMSSRNAYLSPAERAVAPVIYRGLQAAERLYKHQGQHAPAALRFAVMQVLQTEPSIEPLYVSVGEMSTGAELADDADGAARAKKGVMLSVAVKLGKTRLIDNILLEP